MELETNIIYNLTSNLHENRHVTWKPKLRWKKTAENHLKHFIIKERACSILDTHLSCLFKRKVSLPFAASQSDIGRFEIEFFYI